MLLSTDQWKWEKPQSGGCYSEGFWVGTDPEGKKWFVKLKGSFYGYRELVFSRIALLLGWSHQRSLFASFSEETLARLKPKFDDRFHVVSAFLEQHGDPKKCRDCPLVMFQRLDSKPSIRALKAIPITNILDLPRSEIAAFLFGSNDGPEPLYTQDHRMIMIDSEQFFSGSPSDPRNSEWWMDKDEGPKLVVEVCLAIGSLSDEQLEECLRIPNGVVIQPFENLTIDDIKRNVFLGRDKARDFVVNEPT
jgi:hypothetical protein